MYIPLPALPTEYVPAAATSMVVTVTDVPASKLPTFAEDALTIASVLASVLEEDCTAIVMEQGPSTVKDTYLD